MSRRPFRFGVLAGHVPEVGGLTAIARSAEELGFDTLVVPDPVGPFDPMAALAAVAGATTRLRFGTFVLAVSYRDR
jgi:alkanesulfonate monooxygenase SsuD/methylene tetrahydromethanopterin reductase-like flavin-dependent oxidoreductase (luciferase family)